MEVGRLLVAVILVIGASSLKAKHAQTLQNYSVEEYLGSLADLDKKVRADWGEIRKLISATKDRLNTVNISNAERVSILEESMAEERDVLGRIESYVGLPFGLKPCAKSFNLTDYDRREIAAQLEHIRESIRKLQANIDRCGDCVRLREIRKEISTQEQYMRDIENIVSAECRYQREFREDAITGMIDLNRSLPVSNLAAPNWAYGNISANEYKYMMFAMASKFNISKCKLSQPFAVGRETCMKCPSEKPMFNLGKGECMECPPNYYFSRKRNNCTKGTNNESEPRLYNSNRKALNFIGKRPLFNDTLSTCSQQAPFSNGDECIVCRLPLVFSFNSMKCMRCPQQTTYSMNLRRCVQPSRSMFSSLDDAQNWITNRTIGEVLGEWRRQHQKNKQRECPPSVPFFDGVSCVACQLPRVFNLESKLCLTPIRPYLFDQNIHRIVRKSSEAYNTRPDSPFLLIEPDVKAPTNTSNLCPPDRPYFDGITCVQCEEPKPIFNYKSKLCTMCSQGKIFDPTSKRCEVARVRYYTNLQSPNILLPAGKTIDDFQKEQDQLRKETPFDTELCPIETPFFFKGSCRRCSQLEPLFSLESNSCTACSYTEKFSNELHKCLQVKFATDVNAANLLVRKPQTYSKLVAAYEQSKSNRVENQLTGCPAQRPYFNGKECLACTDTEPLFSLEDRICTKCPQGKEYSAKTRTCVGVSFATSPSAPNLVVNDINRYREDFQVKQKQNEHLRQCPSATPYFSKKGCISCPSEHRLFDLDKQLCVRCRSGLHYHPDKLRCLAEKVSISSSLQKMLMNIG